MSFPRHREIFPSDGGASLAANAPAHRLDEFPAGYSLAGCSPAEPASASPAGHQYAVMSSCRSRTFHRTVNCVLTVCVRLGGKRRFDPAAFSLPTLGTWGNLGRGVLDGPGVAEFDFSIFKTIPITERTRVLFRAEFFNIANRANFNLPNPVIFSGPSVSPSAAKITSTTTSSRQIQFGLKLMF